MPLGYRDLAEAKANRVPLKVLTQLERAALAAAKEPVYKKFEAEHPKDFWKKWTQRCPAFRADYVDKREVRDRQCGATAIITAKEGRKKKILCPECGYEGPAFSLQFNNS